MHYLSNDQAALSVVFWPSLFAFSDAEAQVSASVGQHRGCFLIGLDLDIKSKGETVELQRDLLRRLQDVIDRSFEPQVRQHRIFVDEPVEPKLSIRVVRRGQLGQLVLDRHMWPLPLETLQALVISGSREFDSSQAYFALSDEASSMSEPGVSKPAQKLRPAEDVLGRLRWDPNLDASDYVVVYLDRFTGYQELPLSSWKSETSDEEFIPQHRITAFKKRSTGEVVWHREARIDRIFT